MKAQWELNLQISELRMKAQLPTPLEVREQCRGEIQAGLDQSLIMLTSLQEDPTLQQVETKAWELQ